MKQTPKEKLEIDNLPSLDQILSDNLYFLNYSTRKRNIAYQIQHLCFMRNLYRNYRMYGSVRSIFIQQAIVLVHSIIESTLYCILLKEGKIRKNNKGHVEFAQMINVAKKSKEKIISKGLYKKLIILNDLRNCLHPQKQNDLHINKFNIEDINNTLKTSGMFFEEAKLFYKK